MSEHATDARCYVVRMGRPSGPVLEARRVALGLTRPEVAKRMNVNESTVWRIERRGVTPQRWLGVKLERFYSRLERTRGMQS